MKNPTIDLFVSHYEMVAVLDEYADYQDNLCWCGIEFECFNCRNADMPQGGEQIMDDFVDDFPDFLSDDEIMEILAVEAELGIDLTDLEDEYEDDFFSEYDADVEEDTY